MPIPKPSSKEKKDKKGLNTYMQKCMHKIGKEYPQSQAVAICMSTYRAAKKKKESKGSTEEPTWEETETEKVWFLD